jgi:hypothetical protein
MMVGGRDEIESEEEEEVEGEEGGGGKRSHATSAKDNRRFRKSRDKQVRVRPLQFWEKRRKGTKEMERRWMCEKRG